MAQEGFTAAEDQIHAAVPRTDDDPLLQTKQQFPLLRRLLQLIPIPPRPPRPSRPTFIDPPPELPPLPDLPPLPRHDEAGGSSERPAATDNKDDIALTSGWE